MKRFILILRNLFLIIYIAAIHLFAGLFIYENLLKKYIAPESVQVTTVSDPTEKIAVPTPVAIPSIIPEETAQSEINPNQTNTNENFAPDAAVVVPDASSDRLMIPVLGVKRTQLTDTFNAARSSGRVHNANDIMAPDGAPVIAANDGEIAKFFDSERGGITIYQYSPDKRIAYYYAHLQRRADNLRVGDFVKKGTVIGYVGDTGNSGAGNYHLHFSITLLEDSKNVFKGTEINPYPMLKDGIEAQ